MLYTFVNCGSHPRAIFVCRPGYLCYLAAMSTLDAVLEEKMEALAKEKSAKQSGKARLIADPYITTTSLVERLGNFMRHKASKDLWSLISPPPGLPATYGWHSLPHAEWLLKASSLLYELLGVAVNSKIQSKKLTKALLSMHQQHDLQLRTWGGHTVSDACDKLDFTIRVLMAMLRQLKASSMLKTKVFRSLPKRDQCCLDLVLARLQLPAEFIIDEPEQDEDGKVNEICTHPSPAECVAMVPYKSSEATSQPTGKNVKGKRQTLRELPSIFSRSMKDGIGEDKPGNHQEVCPQVPEYKGASAKKSTGEESKVPKKAVKTGAATISSVLNQAMQYVPVVTEKKPKAKGKAKKKNAGSTKKSKSKAAKAEKGKKTETPKKKAEKTKKDKDPPKEDVAQGNSTVYQAGDYNVQRKKFIEEYIETNEGSTKTVASLAWGSSVKRASLLCDVPLSELKRRRFVGKECTENPFQAQVLAAQQ